MVFEMSWIKHRLRNSPGGYEIHILQKQISPIKGQRQQIDGDYKLLTCCSIVIFSFSNHFISLLLLWKFFGEFMCIFLNLHSHFCNLVHSS